MHVDLSKGDETHQPLRRMNFHKGNQLEEINFGLQLSNLKGNAQEWTRLRQVLKKSANEMEKCVVRGTAPLFGYPAVLYQSDDHFPMKVFADNVLSKNENRVTISELIKAKKLESARVNATFTKF